jgi:hypothetical protein
LHRGEKFPCKFIYIYIERERERGCHKDDGIKSY